ncbi:MAG: murein biosynthesis integral membrane protein MurJ [Planctomycetaceae bacterium]
MNHSSTSSHPGEHTLSPETSTEEESSSRGWLKGLRIVGLCTLLSRVLGLVRDIGMAMVFGNGVVMDAFSVAFRIPNLARRLFGEGALTAAFLPAFVKEDQQHGRDSAWKLASSVFTALAVVLIVMVLTGEILLGALHLIGNFGLETTLLISLTAVMLPYLVLICLAAQVSAVLHALGHFTWPALLPVLLNVVWILCLWLIVPELDTAVERVLAVAICVLFGGCLQLAAPLPSLFRLGYRYRPEWRESRETVQGIGRAMLPIMLGLSITQINTLADSLIAWGFAQPENSDATMSLPGNPEYPLTTGTASALYFGQRLYQFPLGVFGVALGTVLFPLLSRHAQAGRMDRVRDTLSDGLRLVICIGFPASVGLMLLAEPLTTLLFQRGAFDTQDAQQTAGIIVCYASAVWAYCGLLIVHRAFYALGDRQTPLRAGLFAVGLNLVLNLTLIWNLGGQGLALGTAVASIIQVITVTILIQSRLGKMDWKRIAKTAAKSVFATVVMSLACWFTMEQLGDDQAGLGDRFMRVGVPLGSSLVIFGIAAWLVGLDELWMLFRRSGSNSDQNDSVIR